MSLLHKVVSLELSKALKERKVPEESLFCWTSDNDIEYLPTEIRNNSVCISAFTSDELMDILPCFIDTKKHEPYNGFWLEVHKRSAKNIQYCVKYICDTQGIDRYGNLASVAFPMKNIHDEKLADALAKMLIFLIDEKLYEKILPIDTGQLL